MAAVGVQCLDGASSRRHEDLVATVLIDVGDRQIERKKPVEFMLPQ
jgi:hypothetical protein